MAEVCVDATVSSVMRMQCDSVKVLFFVVLCFLSEHHSRGSSAETPKTERIMLDLGLVTRLAFQ